MTYTQRALPLYCHQQAQTCERNGKDMEDPFYQVLAIYSFQQERNLGCVVWSKGRETHWCYQPSPAAWPAHAAAMDWSGYCTDLLLSILQRISPKACEADFWCTVLNIHVGFQTISSSQEREAASRDLENYSNQLMFSVMHTHNRPFRYGPWLDM